MAGSLVMVHVVGIVVRLSPDAIMPRCKFLLVGWVGPARVGDRGEDSEFSYETRGSLYLVVVAV
jgi:hypothetical protein